MVLSLIKLLTFSADLGSVISVFGCSLVGLAVSDVITIGFLVEPSVSASVLFSKKGVTGANVLPVMFVSRSISRMSEDFLNLLPISLSE